MTDFSEILFSLLIATALAGLVGLEREMRAQKEGFSGKSLLLSGIVGGFASSPAVTTGISTASRSQKVSQG